MMKPQVIVLCLALAALGATTAQADWYEDFESYAVGSGLHGQGGWAAWDDDPTFDAFITNAYAHGGMNSVEIMGASDMVHRYSGYTSDTWVFSAWMYIPNDFTGLTYFIMLNQYAVGGVNNWSVQVSFTGGQVTSDSDPTAALPWITGEWVELRVVIDLDADIQMFYYGDDMLYSASWTAGVSGGGILDIAAVDLFANGSTPVYYDDMSLTPDVVAVEGATWGEVKTLFR